ncbi:MAG: adenylate kinase [Bdellovibrionales bacterium]|nr:adenylate kinase [Bdellovibrionales bacterium]
MNLIIFGAPGAGKGTQSELLVEKLGKLQISTGDLFRSAMRNKTALGLEAKAFIDKGLLVPDSVTLGMVEEVLRSVDRPFVLDGFPRNLDQAKALEEILVRVKLQVEKVVFLEVPTSLLLARLTGRRVCKKCGTVYHVDTKPPKKSGVCDNCNSEVVQRADDSEKVILDRLKVYAEYTAPLKEYYGQQGKLVHLDGNQAAEKVFEDLRKVIS